MHVIGPLSYHIPELLFPKPLDRCIIRLAKTWESAELPRKGCGAPEAPSKLSSCACLIASTERVASCPRAACDKGRFIWFLAKGGTSPDGYPAGSADAAVAACTAAAALAAAAASIAAAASMEETEEDPGCAYGEAPKNKPESFCLFAAPWSPRPSPCSWCTPNAEGITPAAIAAREDPTSPLRGLLRRAWLTFSLATLSLTCNFQEHRPSKSWS